MEKELKKQYYKGFFACVKILSLLSVGFYSGLKCSQSLNISTNTLIGGADNAYSVEELKPLSMQGNELDNIFNNITN